MILLYINDVDRTGDLIRNSIRTTNLIQQRADSCDFGIFQNTKPSENQDVRLFIHDTIASFAGTTVTLNGYYQKNIDQFYPGQVLYIRIGDADEEKVTVQSYDEDNLQIILEAAPSGAVAQGDKIGVLDFGGVVSRVTDENVHALTQLEYRVSCSDYTKIFDKKLISDTWADVDSRHIINDFVNTTINLNNTIDNMDYDDNAAIQAEWIEGGDGDNPTIDSTDFIEGDAAGVLPWTNAGGTATFEATPTSRDISDLTGAAAGTPTEGNLMVWIKTSDQANITSLKIRIGSDNGNYAEVDIDIPSGTDYEYFSGKLADASMTGNPDWTDVDYAAVAIVETGDGEIKINGIRVNAEKSFTLYNVKPTPTFDDFRSPQLKSTSLIQLLAKTWDFLWYIDYERDIHFINIEDEVSPFGLNDASANFIDLEIETDASQIGNRVIIRGGEKTSDSTYSQAIPGDGAKREWLLKNKFKNLVVLIDDITDAHAAEAGTTDTNIKITGHGLSTGDYITNQDRREEVREITKVDVDNFTVESIPGQIPTDTITFFTIPKSVGVEGLVDETTVDYVSNSNEKSIRATDSEATLLLGMGILFVYNERVPIRIQYSNGGSIATLKASGFGDGIFDLDPVTDRNIQDVGTALATAQAKVREYSEATIEGRFRTDSYGLKAGQILHIVDSTRGIDDNYVIQRVKKAQVSGAYSDYFNYTVTFGTSSFGIIEFYQKLLATKDSIELNVDDIVETYTTSDEVVEVSDVNAVATDGGFQSSKIAETVEVSDVNQVVAYPKGTWRYEPNGAGQPLESRYNLCDYG